MLYTLENVRDNLRTREGKRVFFLGAGDSLTSAARDFLKEQRIPILPAENAKITRYETLDGGFLEEKPEHMTQLTGNLLVPKTHPRIVFRGKLDSLEAALLLEARALPEQAKALEEILGCVRKLLRCEVLEEPFVPETLCGLTEREQRAQPEPPEILRLPPLHAGAPRQPLHFASEPAAHPDSGDGAGGGSGLWPGPGGHPSGSEPAEQPCVYSHAPMQRRNEPMKLKTTLLGKTYLFRDLKQVLAKANEEKSGDKLAGLAAESAQERIAAKVVLSGVTLQELREHPAVPYETDEVTRIIQDDLNLPEYEKIKLWTVSELREWILDENTTGADIRRRSRGLTAEMAAAVCKLMSNLDLIYAARKITVTAHCNTTIGLPGTLSCRLQPNHTTDDPEGITASVLEGLSFGAGDAVIGLNPVTDSPEQAGKILRRFQEIKEHWAIPTQICVLAHVTAQMKAVRGGRALRSDLPVHRRQPEGQRGLRLQRASTIARGPGS